MSEKPSIQTLLNRIKRNFFRGIEIDPEKLKNEASRTDFICCQADRLFCEERNDPTPNHSVFNLYHYFIKVVRVYEHRLRPDSPLNDPQQVATLSADDQLVCAALSDLAALLALLDCRQPFDFWRIGLSEPEIYDMWGEEMTSFTMANKQLVEYIQQTPYRLLAAHIVASMVNVKLDLVMGRNMVMQDYLAQQGNDIYVRFLYAEMGTEEYINYALSYLSRIARHEHIAETQYGMDVDMLALNDILTAPMVDDFRDEFYDEHVATAKKLSKYLNRHLDIKPTEKEFIKDFLQYADPLLEPLPIPYEDLTHGHLVDFASSKYKERYA